MKELLKLARDSIATSFSGKEPDIPNGNDVHQGVFVTLHKNGDLRGCIGYPEPIMPLSKAVTECARAAAFCDPRFPPLKEDELKHVKIEISVLTVPKEIDKGRLPNAIRVGTDGLIIRSAITSGLLLPQVATEYNWSADEFVQHACEKAGLPADAWKDDTVAVFTFQAKVISE